MPQGSQQTANVVPIGAGERLPERPKVGDRFVQRGVRYAVVQLDGKLAVVPASALDNGKAKP